MIIKPISQKGKNRVREGLGTDVIEIMENHPSNPPAVLVAPRNEPTISSKHSRWIVRQHDRDFKIVEE